jgi:putrescine aminotransferase
MPGFRQVPQPSPGRCGYCEPAEGCTLRCAEALEETVRELGAENVAAVVAEPVAILQAVKVPHEAYWPTVREICDANGILLILDEVVTGFGRTGKMFGAEHWGVRPDILTMAKGITSGYVPLGAVAASRRVEEAFAEPLLHLNTYAGHPVACEAGLACLEILARERLVERAETMEPVLRACLEDVAASLRRVCRTTAVGLLSSIEVRVEGLDDAEGLVLDLRHAIYESGVLARCSKAGDVVTVVFYPALVVAPDEIEAGVRAVGSALERCVG